MRIEAVVLDRDQSLRQQRRHVAELDQHAVLALLRIDAADQHRIEPYQITWLVLVGIGDVGDHIATETDAEPFRCLHAIPEIETARVDIDALRPGAVGRSEARRVGEAWVSTGKSRWGPYT